jgi:hypothetical protein
MTVEEALEILKRYSSQKAVAVIEEHIEELKAQLRRQEAITKLAWNPRQMGLAEQVVELSEALVKIRDNGSGSQIEIILRDKRIARDALSKIEVLTK